MLEQTNQYKICSNATNCPPTQQPTYDKLNKLGYKQCVQNCSDVKYVWYLHGNIKVCTQNTTCNETEIYIYYLKDEPRECYHYCQSLAYYGKQLYESVDNEFECVESCGDKVYRAVKTQNYNYNDLRCSNDTQCDYVSIPPEYQKQNTKECIRCEHFYSYVYEDGCHYSCNTRTTKYISADSQYCTTDCNGFAYYLIQSGEDKCTKYTDCTQILDEEGLQYYLVQDRLECLQPADNCDKIYNTEYKYIKNNTDYSCRISACDEFNFYLDEYRKENISCIENCLYSVNFMYTNVQEYDINYIQICSTKDEQCPPEHPTGPDYEYKQYLTKQVSEKYKKTYDKMCIQKCMNFYNFLKYDSDVECVEECGKDNNTNKYYVYSYENGDQKCRNETECKENEFLIIQSYRYECIKETQACFDQNSYIYNKNGNKCEENPCDNYNSYFTNKFDEQQLICQEECEQGVYFAYSITYKNEQGFVMICQENQTTCPPFAWEGSDKQYIQSLNKYYNQSCLTDCHYTYSNSNEDSFRGYISYGNDTKCIDRCNSEEIFQVIENDYQCILNDTTCQDNQKTLYIQGYFAQHFGIECKSSCKEMIYLNKVYYQKSKTNESFCTDQCDTNTWIYDQDKNENICSECGEQQYVIDDTNQCVDLISDKCPEENSGKYIKNADKKQCQRVNCTKEGYYYKNQYSVDVNKKCYSKCIGVWFYDQQQTDKRICRLQDTTCPPSVMTSDNETYIKSLTKIQDNQCVQQCDKNYYMHYDNENLCYAFDDCLSVSTIILKDQTKYIYCDHNYDCNKFDQDKQQQIFYIDYDEDFASQYMCVEQCESGIWYQYHDQKQCIKQCGDNPDLFTFELSQHECSQYNNAECKQLYHIEVEQFNTKCQYVNDAQNCSSFQNYGGYIYESNTNEKLCMQCNEANQFITIDKLHCVETCGQNVWYNNGSNNLCVDSQQCSIEGHTDLTKQIKETKQCVSECIGNYQYFQVEGQNENAQTFCVKSCEGSYAYRQNTQCVQVCTDEYAEPVNQEDKVCSKTCNFQVDQSVSQCIIDNQCSEQQLKAEISEQRYQCSADCSDIIKDGFSFIKGDKCLGECDQDEKWIELSQYNKICTGKQSCSEVDHAGRNYEDVITNNTQCKPIECQVPNYHVDTVESVKCVKECQNDTNMWYQVDEQNKVCIEGQQCPDSQLQIENSNQCVTECPEDLKQQDNKCVEQSQKLSGGGIAGIIIAVVIVIAAIVIAAIIFIKKNKNSSTDVEMNRGNKIE